MEKVTILPVESLVNGWIDPKYIPEGQDKYYYRNLQSRKPSNCWRHLRSDEIERLVKNDNTASSWDTIWVTDEFEPKLLKNNRLYGTIRIGRMVSSGLQFHDLRLPVGITNSSVHSCDIGDDCAIHDVHYLSHYIIGDRCMLFNINEMSTTDHSKFGNGIIKEGESESVRVRIQIMNETGCRSVCPFDGMITADAYMWGKFIEDKVLMQRLDEITQNSMDCHRGYYGTVGDGCVIKTSSIIKDVKIGDSCYIKGASKLKNITINSNEKEPTQIGENVILVNGIVGYGCRIFYGCIGVKFVIGRNCSLKYGARVIDSILGDNSTISCCEVLNNLIFPAHEQHHNNSFLIASCIQGQSNMAAGATVGSNHNSRTNDGEIVAGRGFWPGLCSSLKHSSVFASYILLSKGAYPAELNIPLPFSLVSNNEKLGQLEILPAYWWVYNMYALARNNWKFQNRDKRVAKVQHIEFETFAPDSMEEALKARRLLEIWVARANLAKNGESSEKYSEKELGAMGKNLLETSPELVDSLDVLGENVERSKRRVSIRKPRQAYNAYGDMLIHYAMTNAMKYLEAHPGETLGSLSTKMQGERQAEWINLGGQLMTITDFDHLRDGIRKGELNNWNDIHSAYDRIWARYPEDKLRHAYRSLLLLLGTDTVSADMWNKLIDKEKRIQEFIRERTYYSRKKDYDNSFRNATFRNAEEMNAAFGDILDNDFIRRINKETDDNLARLENLRKRI